MSITFTQFWDTVSKQLIDWAIKVVDEMLDKGVNYVSEFSPVDTWKFKEDNKIIPAHNKNWVVTWVLFNDWEYAQQVEEWFKKSSVNWHIDNRNKIYPSIWADVYKRTIRELKDDAELHFDNLIIN